MRKQSNSWTASVIASLAAWGVLSLLSSWAFGLAIPLPTLLLANSLAAAAQAVVLRLLFFKLHLDRSLGYGLVFGAVTGAMLITAELALFPALMDRFTISLLTAALAGAATGALLSQFYKISMTSEEQSASEFAAD